jgi:predicted lipoprotein with Yx(FWY)xxD motif
MNVKNLRSNSNRYQVRLVAVVLLGALGLAAGSAVAGTSRSTSSVAVKTRTLKGLGVDLVNKAGRTLYVFSKDAQTKKVTCKGTCLIYWHPLKWKGSSKPKAGGAAKSSLLGTVKASGGKVVTYNKWPLYTYSGDTAGGQTNGENQNLNGGKWWVISSKGKVTKHKSSSGGSGGTTWG